MMKSTLRVLCASLVFGLGASACDGDNSRPDTGYGANQTVPSEKKCSDLCERMSDCGGQLCVEDTGNSAYLAAFDALRSFCEDECSADAAVLSRFNDEAWRCLFTMSCRKVLGDDACHAQASYQCQ